MKAGMKLRYLPQLALLGAVGGAAAWLRSRYERDHFVVEETTITSEKIQKPRKLVFLSDLHDKEFGAGNDRLLSSIRHIKPDLILIGGDTMVVKEGKESLAVTERLLQGLSELKLDGENGETFSPEIYYAGGNHEQRMRWQGELYGTMYWEFRKLLDRYGVIYLEDASAEVGSDLRISGLDIKPEYYRNLKPTVMHKDYLEEHLGKADAKRFQILLSHSPLFLDAYMRWGADLTLSGHFHGGTIRIPFLGGVMTPQYQFFLPWCAGTFQKHGRYMIVSRGLGTHSINIRLNNKPQVVVVRLCPETAVEGQE